VLLFTLADGCARPKISSYYFMPIIVLQKFAHLRSSTISAIFKHPQLAKIDNKTLIIAITSDHKYQKFATKSLDPKKGSVIAPSNRP
jgi:hypothetical protein